MNRIIIKGSSFILPDNNEAYTTLIPKSSVVTSADIKCSDADEKFAKNEQISREFFYAADKLIRDLGGADNFPENNTGISFGTLNGCYSSLSISAANIAVKGVKGMRPKDATNCIMSGAAAKAAIKLGIKGFSLTNCDGYNAGLDAVIFAYDMLRRERCKYAVAGAGDEGSAYAALMLESIKNENRNSCFISGCSRGLVYGIDIGKQLKLFIKEALSSSGYSSGDIGKIILASNTLSNYICKAAKDIFKDIEIYICDIPKNVTSARGLIAIEYAKSILSKYQNNTCALILQCSKEGYFSALVITQIRKT